MGETTGVSGTGIAYGGFNGGGCAFTSDSRDLAHGWGGASDVRLIVGSWDAESSLLSRIIVAGGGASEDPSEKAGAGGGPEGHLNSAASPPL